MYGARSDVAFFFKQWGGVFKKKTGRELERRTWDEMPTPCATDKIGHNRSPEMRPIIIGTAGHIDHGKTALVRALTGIDTDRLEEEKRRGISIDLGFAHLGRFSFVDVPGHERFIKNMLAGAAGIDLVLLVIAADESIKPQTREHFDICRLLGIKHGVVALTKSDLVDPDLLDLARLEVEEFLAGSFLESAPIIPVSSTTGAGLDQLRAALEEAAQKIEGKNAAAHPRLPIDRSFSIRGHGAVVTGTLISGTLKLHDEVELYPTGKRAKIRALEVHSVPVDQAHAGERTAVNLSGIDSAEAARGMVLAPPAIFRPTRQIDAKFTLLPAAHPLKHRAPVHFHAGTAEVEAKAHLLSSLDPVKPGTTAHVRFLLRDPLLILPGDRFIVRMFSPVVTIGGGTVLDIDAPLRMKRTGLDRRLANLETGDRISLLVDESKYGLSLADLVARTGLLPSQISTEDWLISPAAIDQLLAQIRRTVADFHKKNPLRPGIAKESLKPQGAPPFLLDKLLVRAKDLVAEGEIVRLASHRVALKEDESQALEKIESAFRAAGLTVPSTNEVLTKSGVDPVRSRTLLQILLKNRRLIRVNEDLIYHPKALEDLKKLLAAHKGARFSVPDFKDWTGISRKYAIPLLEFLDREKITRREGENRLIL
ncbi:MAG TPA: selenocysteine-specific translation elongation factor [Bryobacteraceae bacterium]|nr:selenocysteine-specific translation elongation factor [Bryobacteraceae bacterium]